MTSQSSIMEKTSTFPDEKIHIMPKDVVHFHGHQNKMVPHMKPFILVDLSNEAKFHNCICWLTNYTQCHHLSRWVSYYHIGNKYLVLLDHVEIGS